MEIIGYGFHNPQMGIRAKIGNRIVRSSIAWDHRYRWAMSIIGQKFEYLNAVTV